MLLWKANSIVFLIMSTELALVKFPLILFQSKAAFERESDVPLKTEEFEVTKTAGTERWGWGRGDATPIQGWAIGAVWRGGSAIGVLETVDQASTN